MYPAELEIKDTTESNTSASYLELFLSIESDGQLRTSLYDKRDDSNFHITNFLFLSSNIPSSPAYGVFISSPEPKARVSYCHSAPLVVRPSVVVCPSVVHFSYFRLLLQNRWMDFYETWLWMKYSWSPTSVVVFQPDPPRGGSRAGQNMSRGPLLQESSSSDRKATATNRMHSNDLETYAKKCCYCWFHSEVKFLTRFDVFWGFAIFVYFNATLIDLYGVKSFICIYFV